LVDHVNDDISAEKNMLKKQKLKKNIERQKPLKAVELRAFQ